MAQEHLRMSASQQPAVSLVPAEPGRVAAINPAEIWGAGGGIGLATLIWATGIPTRLGLSPEEASALVVLGFVFAAVVRGTFQAWASGKRRRELAEAMRATAQQVATPELVSSLVVTLRPLVERMLEAQRGDDTVRDVPPPGSAPSG